MKSVSLSRKEGHAEFPDAVTSRGKKHLESLMSANKQGYESYLMFLIQIEKCNLLELLQILILNISKFLRML